MKKKSANLNKVRLDSPRHSGLEKLFKLVSEWTNALDLRGDRDFSDRVKTVLNNLNAAFDSKDAKIRNEALFQLQNAFSGGMLSINDLGDEGSALRVLIDKEKLTVVKKYWVRGIDA